MLNQDQYLSPPHQQPISKTCQATSSKCDEYTASTAAEPSASLSIMEEKGSITDASGITSSNNIERPATAESSTILLGDKSCLQPTPAAPTAIAAASVLELQDADESKGGNSRSQSRSLPSPPFKVEKEREHRSDNHAKTLKRLQNNTIESRSPKLVKCEDNNHADHATAVNQGTI